MTKLLYFIAIYNFNWPHNKLQTKEEEKKFNISVLIVF